jgi:hypothetical protein
MKNIFLLILMAFLAACGSKPVKQELIDLKNDASVKALIDTKTRGGYFYFKDGLSSSKVNHRITFDGDTLIHSVFDGEVFNNDAHYKYTLTSEFGSWGRKIDIGLENEIYYVSQDSSIMYERITESKDYHNPFVFKSND